jgi:hypothetical protein
MHNIIDVKVVIDTVSILATHSSGLAESYRKPLKVDDTQCYMIASATKISRGQATSHLHLKLPSGSFKKGNIIRWRSFALSGNAGQCTVIYDIANLSHGAVTGKPTTHETLIELPVPIIENNCNTEPPTYTLSPQKDYFLQSEITDKDTVQYDLRFYITSDDNGTGTPEIQGYFRWNPTLTTR